MLLTWGCFTWVLPLPRINLGQDTDWDHICPPPRSAAKSLRLVKKGGAAVENAASLVGNRQQPKKQVMITHNIENMCDVAKRIAVCQRNVDVLLTRLQCLRIGIWPSLAKLEMRARFWSPFEPTNLLLIVPFECSKSQLCCILYLRISNS